MNITSVCKIETDKLKKEKEEQLHGFELIFTFMDQRA